MRKLLVSVAAIALISSPATAPLLGSLGPTPVHAQSTQASISVFFDGLREHGSWVSHPRHRYVWVPTVVDAGWRPYSNGHWAYTERFGWFFVSDEPFAWAVYHYGRWAFEPGIGWYWVPGTRWAPAWVSWRRGGDYIGWAPLPPEGDGFAVSIEVSTASPPPGHWVFVPVNRFAAPDLSVVIVQRDEIPVIYDQTEVLGPVVVENNVVVNNVIDIDYIRENAEDEVTVVEVQEVDDPAQAAETDTPAVFTGEIAAEEDASPEEAVEPTEVEAPTAGQEVESDDEATGTTGEEATEEAPEDGAPAEEQPTDEAPAAGETPADEAPTDEAEEAPAEEQPADEAPAEEQPAEEAPADAAPTEETPAEGAPAEEAPVEEAPTEEMPAEEPPAEEAPAEAAPEQEQPAEEQPAEEAEPAPADEAPVEEAPAEEAPSTGQPAEGTPAEECPPNVESC